MLYVCSDEVQGKPNAFLNLIRVPTGAEHHNASSVYFTKMCFTALNST